MNAPSKRLFLWTGLFLLTAAAQVTAADAACDPAAGWPQWRGPLGTGVAPLAEPPVSWSETNHVRWKVRIPGEGDSTPAVWGNKVFILTAIPTGKKLEPKGAPAPAAGTNAPAAKPKSPDEFYQFAVLCYDRQSGQMLWQKTACEVVPHQGHHQDHGFASASPVTDGESLLAYFGSEGLYCFDLEGNLKWSKDLGPMTVRSSFGEGSSPALRGNTVIVYRDDETDNDFVVALDKRTGKELWRTPRNETTGWTSPCIVDFGGKSQVVINATSRVRSYDLATGKELWCCGGQTRNAIPTPVASADTLYVVSGFQSNACFAIALGREGDLTGTDAIRWSHFKNMPYVPSPLLVDNFLYTLTVNNGVLSCFDAKTGAVQFEGERLEGINNIYSSPVAAQGRVYVQGRDGLCYVVREGARLEVLARNKLSDKFDASPVPVGKSLLLRGEQYLYCVGD